MPPSNYIAHPEDTTEEEEVESLLSTLKGRKAGEGKSHDGTAITTNKMPAASSPTMIAADTLRGIGIVLVILYHMGYQKFKNAWFCISLFFSLSGFLITKVAIEAYERRGRVDITKFWAKRISRLFPALLLIINLIAWSQKLPYRKSHHDNGFTFQREANDLFYAAIFATNFNLVYNQVDDYFDDFSPPSITRHLWTLSIEEQYYIIWPLVIWCLTSLSKKQYLWAILFLDMMVMGSSYFSSLATINKMGTSAAYFSTWCRMGDIATGGFVYTASRLIPPVASRLRIIMDSKLPMPMTLAQKVSCEVLAQLSLIVGVGVPMLQIPVEDMLPLYFGGGRFVSVICPTATIAVTMMNAEPSFPPWAIATKILSNSILGFVGIISYGLYLYHWPIIVYFGDPNGMQRKKIEMGMEEANEDEFLSYLMRDMLLIQAVFLIGYASFVYYEKRALIKSRKTSPCITITTGLLSMGVTLLTIWFVAKDLEPMQTFENDSDEIFGNGGVDGSRFTPVLSTIEPRNMFSIVLDYNTRVPFKTVSNAQKPFKNQGGYEDIIEAYREFSPSVGPTVIIMCKNIRQSPCQDPEVWKGETYWVWVESQELCGESAGSVSRAVYEERCEDVISIAEINPDPLDLDVNYSGNHECFRTCKLRLLGMMLNIEDTFPNVINRNSISRMKQEYQAYLASEEEFLDLSTPSGEKWDPIKITVLGESVALRMGMYFKDIADTDLLLTNKAGTSEFPTIKINNLAFAGLQAIAYYACLSTHPRYQYYEQCHNFEYDAPYQILKTFSITHPGVVVVHDSHWARDHSRPHDPFFLPTLFERVMAFNIMMQEAANNGVKGIFFLTLSPHVEKIMNGRGAKVRNAYFTEMNTFMKVVDTLSCSKDDASSIRVTVVDWAKLVCPQVSVMKCEQRQHGFEKILADSFHPSGQSGLWLTRVVLALIIEEITQNHLPGKHKWSPMKNPVTKELLALALQDGDSFGKFEDLVSSYYLCPHTDLEKLEEKFNATRTMFGNHTSY